MFCVYYNTLVTNIQVVFVNLCGEEIETEKNMVNSKIFSLYLDFDAA